MREQDPVLRQLGLDGETMLWFVTRYEDVAAVLDDERFVRDPRLALTPEELAAEPDAACAGCDREPHAEPRRRGSPTAAPPGHEGLHAEDGGAAAAAHPGDRGRAPRRGRGARRGRSVRGLRLPAADHRDRGAARRPAGGSRPVPRLDGRDRDARARPGRAGEVLRADGRVRRLPRRALRRSARRADGRPRQRAPRRARRGRRALGGGGLRDGRPADRRRARDDGRPDRQRRPQPAHCTRSSSSSCATIPR